MSLCTCYERIGFQAELIVIGDIVVRTHCYLSSNCILSLRMAICAASVSVFWRMSLLHIYGSAAKTLFPLLSREKLLQLLQIHLQCSVYVNRNWRTEGTQLFDFFLNKCILYIAIRHSSFSLLILGCDN